MNRVKNKVAVVTGGGKNIGRAVSLTLAKEGAQVCILDIDTNLGKETVNRIKRRNGSAYFFECDVTSTKQIFRVSTEIIEKYHHVDILVNNVGGSKGLKLADISEEDYQLNLDLNLKSAMFCTKAFLQNMIKYHSGSVIFVSSINALLGGFSEVAYSSAKGALHSLVRVLTADYSKYGVRFNVVCPGSIPKESVTWQNREKNNPGLIQRLSRTYPLRRVGKPDDVANAVLFLASDESSWITGIILPVDGGLTATGSLPGGKWWKAI
jgi:NAD(P)-dependent dehydrogenase (short-subunit alcohol dehydrogenase family)